MSFKAVKVEFAKNHHYLVQCRVDQEVFEDWGDNVFTSILCIQLQHVDSHAEIVENGEKDDHEVDNVLQSSHDEGHIEGRIVE